MIAIQKKINPSYPLLSETSDYPIQIQAISEGERISPALNFHLIHRETGLQIPGQFTAEEASRIQTVTQSWDWRMEKGNKPGCASPLLPFLQALCAPPADNMGGAL